MNYFLIITLPPTSFIKLYTHVVSEKIGHNEFYRHRRHMRRDTTFGVLKFLLQDSLFGDPREKCLVEQLNFQTTSDTLHGHFFGSYIDHEVPVKFIDIDVLCIKKINLRFYLMISTPTTAPALKYSLRKFQEFSKMRYSYIILIYSYTLYMIYLFNHKFKKLWLLHIKILLWNQRQRLIHSKPSM